MKNLLWASLLICLVSYSYGQSDNKAGQKATSSVNASDSTLVLCGKCGEIKGSAACCRKDAVKCEKCGLDKGSPGCCKIKGDTQLCTKCGEIKGSTACCNKDSVRCNKCGLIKGSPGCCKVKK